MTSIVRAATAAALVLSVVIVAGPAGAAVGTSCKVSIGRATIAPGLSSVPAVQTITATTTLSGCTGGGVTAGTGRATLKLGATDCTGLAKGASKEALTETVTWNGRKASTFTGTTLSGTGARVLQATISGTVTVGLFKGSRVSTTFAYSVNRGETCSKTTAITGLSIKGLKPFVIR
jgi:hypothetical protein